MADGLRFTSDKKVEVEHGNQESAVVLPGLETWLRSLY